MLPGVLPLAIIPPNSLGESGVETKSPPKIAVVAIHGVSRHASGATLKLTTDMLLRECGKHYTPYHIETELIPVHPLTANPFRKGDTLEDPKKSFWQTLIDFGERQKFMDLYRRHEDKRRNGESIISPHHGFMRDLLRNYPKDKKDTYSLQIHKMERVTETEKREVHLCEMYWDDLSQVSNSLLRVLGELYHLMFHLPHIGNLTVDLARGANKGMKPNDMLWRAYSFFTAFAGRSLTIGVPLLNILLFALMSVAIPLALPDGAKQWGAILTVPAALAFGGGFLFWLGRKDKSTPGWVQLAIFLLLVEYAVVAGFWAKHFTISSGVERCLAVQWFLGMLGLYLYGAWAFNFRRPGAFLIGIVVGIPAFGVTLYNILTGDGTHLGIVTGAMNICELVYVALFAAWMLFNTAFLFTLILGSITCFLGKRAIRKKNQRAFWTNCISLSVPSAMFLGLTLVIWMALAMGSESLFQYAETPVVNPPPVSASQERMGLKGKVGKATEPIAIQAAQKKKPKRVKMPYKPVYLVELGFLNANYSKFNPKSFFAGEEVDIEEESDILKNIPLKRAMPLGENVKKEYAMETFLKGMAISSATPFFHLGMLLCLGALILVGWCVFPVSLAEGKPPADYTNNAKSEAMGKWLSNGFHIMVLAGVCVLITMLPLLPAGAWYGIWENRTGGAVKIYENTKNFLGWFGAVLVASAVGIVALRWRLEELAQMFAPLTEAVLDVDNHLRALPTNNTPRARIAARYASLLRYLCDPEKGYNAIIIVAHSQGSVITADLLKFLKEEHEWLVKEKRPESETWEADILSTKTPVPIYLLSFGCPLRQLYSLRFPHLYDWARFDDKEEDPEKRQPDPDALGVISWINLYHSGDYVGRCLWRSEEDRSSLTYDFVGSGKLKPREEYCIGAGAHIRYWDSSSPEVAITLDRMIQEG